MACLREWELGALLAVLEPGRLAEEAAATYAHKLGTGRPLGMGSVRITVESLSVRHEKEAVFSGRNALAAFEGPAIVALKSKIAQSGAQERWLRMHEFAGSPPVGYPMEQSRRIFDWHTNLRRDHSMLRREVDPDWEAVRDKVRRVDPDR